MCRMHLGLMGLHLHCLKEPLTNSQMFLFLRLEIMQYDESAPVAHQDSPKLCNSTMFHDRSSDQWHWPNSTNFYKFITGLHYFMLLCSMGNHTEDTDVDKCCARIWCFGQMLSRQENYGDDGSGSLWMGFERVIYGVGSNIQKIMNIWRYSIYAKASNARLSNQIRILKIFYKSSKFLIFPLFYPFHWSLEAVPFSLSSSLSVYVPIFLQWITTCVSDGVMLVIFSPVSGFHY